MDIEKHLLFYKWQYSFSKTLKIPTIRHELINTKTSKKNQHVEWPILARELSDSDSDR